MSLEGLLNDSCTVRRITQGALDAYGQPAQTVADTSSVACRRWRKSAREQIENREGEIVDWKVALASGADIDVEDELVFTDMTLLVKTVNEHPGGTSHHVEVEAKAVL